MAGKKPTPQKEKRSNVSTGTAALGQNADGSLGKTPFDIKTWALAALVVLITGIVFSGVTKLEWTNWDDDEYVYENDMVMRGDYKAIFKTPVNNNYNPLPVAMMAWEWQQVLGEKDLAKKAKFFHLNNLWFHLAATFLVFWLMQMLGLKPLWAAMAALLFGIHPLRVESVAWITERKDVMFGLFYVAALIGYLKFLDTKKWLWYGVTAILFVLALFSKIQAVSLPLSMLAIDWYRSRKWDLPLILEKVPFFIGAAIIGVLGLQYLQAGATLDANTTFSLAERVPLGLTAYSVYVIKAIFPYETCTFYPYPASLEPLYILGMVGALGIVAAGFFLRKLSRELTFGLAFFSVNIVFLLQILGAGSAYMADRFSYVAYIGLFFALAMVAQRVSLSRKALMPVFAGVIGLFILISGALSWRYIPAWKDSDTLWSDVIGKYPRKIVLAYVNRGQYVRREAQRQRQGEDSNAFNLRREAMTNRAFDDFNVAVELSPQYHLGYLNRGNVYFDRGKNDEALADYTKVLEILAPMNKKGLETKAAAGAYSNRGAIYSRKNMHTEAIADFAMALKYFPNDKNTWNNRAVTYFTIGKYPEAIADLDQYLKLEPDVPSILDMKGLCYLRMGQFKEALPQFDRALQLNGKMPSGYLNRAYAKANLGDRAGALADAQQAQALGQPVDPAFIAGLQQ